MSEQEERPEAPAPPAPSTAEAQGKPKIRFPDELPISARVVDIARAIDQHQVVVVAGETGSGKTTQLPKICLAMGRGLKAFIGCTQPRRLAATSVAARVAKELDTEIGEDVGYKIRFTDKVKPNTYVKFMTDGILLAEIQGDPLLRGYDTIIIDEAHERSLNIDFLLGYLRQLLPRRRDLRVIISSATLETERFSEFFHGAPVVEVSGRTYPVDVLYRPPRQDEADLADVVANTVDEITDLDKRNDVLVFLPGEREIREAADELERRALPYTAILPLYARLSASEQQRVFQSMGQRKVVLATNVAETSLTIPGIVYVVDAGVARVNRYAPRTGVTQLLIEPVSQASANQRKGRCGRTESGVCFRLYEESDFEGRPAYTDPEIKRVGLAGVILRMKALGLGDIEQFPFLDPPQKRAVDEGYRVLEELGALDDEGKLTPVGEQLGRLPVDPRLGRMILGGRDQGALREVLVIAAALGLQDPRERPVSAQQKADEAHRKFRTETSDFVGLLKLWNFWQESKGRGTKGQLRKLCRDNFLSFVRMREWEDIHEQLSRVCREMGFKANDKPANDEQIHKALLPGLLSKIGMWNAEQRVYVGARQTRFQLHPSSALARKQPAWVMAAELVETSQLFARSVAKIEPTWLEEAGGALCKRSYGDPHWEQKPAQVMAKEQVTLYGLPIVKERKAHFGPIDPVGSRRLFIAHALVRHEYQTKGAFMEHNRKLLEEVSRLRDKARRSDMLADEYALCVFFEKRVPNEVFSGKTFEQWRQEAEAKDPRALELSLEDVLLDEADDLSPERYPDELRLGNLRLPLAYKFDPGEDDDGISVTVPLAALPQLDPAVLDWTIPGWHVAKIEALLEGLPKARRKALGGDLRELARDLGKVLRPFDGPMLASLEKAVEQETGERIPRDGWDIRGLPPYLSFWFRIVDEGDKTLAQGRDLAELQQKLGLKAKELWARAPRERFEKTGLKSWSFDALPETVALDVGGRRLHAHPALVDAQDSVELRLLESKDAADEATREGLRRLFLTMTNTSLSKLEAQLPGSLAQGPLAQGAQALPPRRQLVLRALDEAFGLRDPALFPRDKASFDKRLASGRGALSGELARLGKMATDVAAELDKVRAQLKALTGKPGAPRAALDDVLSQMPHLAPPDLLARTPEARLQHIPRYLRAIGVRLQRLPNDPQKDLQKAQTVAPFWQGYLKKREELRARGRPLDEIEDFGWMVEELRVQTFAPELKTAVPVSDKRLGELWAALSRLTALVVEPSNVRFDGLPSLTSSRPGARRSTRRATRG